MKELSSSRPIARTYFKTFRCQLSKGFFLAQRKLRRLLTARNLKYNKRQQRLSLDRNGHQDDNLFVGFNHSLFVVGESIIEAFYFQVIQVYNDV